LFRSGVRQTETTAPVSIAMINEGPLLKNAAITIAGVTVRLPFLHTVIEPMNHGR